MSPQAISQHLKILREAKVVRIDKQAQQRIYRMKPGAMSEIKNWAMPATAKEKQISKITKQD